MSKHLAFIDTETRSAVPIQRGTDLYTRSAQCMIVTWAIDDEPSQIWDRFETAVMPADLDWALDDPDVTLIAHKAEFDRRIVELSLQRHTPLERWHCTMAQAYAHGLPGSLGTLGAVLEIPEDERKLEDDAKLIQLFCVPQSFGWATPKTHPAEWERFKRYALFDTSALRQVYRNLPTHNYRDENLRLWHLDYQINARGFGFDVELANAARALLDKAKNLHGTQSDLMTMGAVTAVTQRDKLLKWLNNSGLSLPNMKAATIREWLEHDDLRPEQRLMLELRLEGAKSSGSKYRRGIETMSPDHRVRCTIQFSGAGRTGRWSGRGYQPHNMKRPTVLGFENGRLKAFPVKAGYIQQVVLPGIMSGAALNEPMLYGGPNEACTNALRSAIIARDGNELTVADWSNIEGRLNAWTADETWKLDAYRAADRGEAADSYKILFSSFFGKAIEDINDTERQVGKVIDLSCGYLAAVGAFVTMAAGYYMDLDELPPLILPGAKEEHKRKAFKSWKRAFIAGEDFGLEPDTFQACHILVQLYREKNENIIRNGRAVGDAVVQAIKQPGALFEIAKCKIWCANGNWLHIQLPSGRRLMYAKPKIGIEKILDLETGKEQIRQTISYMTARGKTWRRESAWAGLFIENIIQAIANDILRAALLLIDEDTKSIPDIRAYLETLPPDERTAICLHVHDEAATDLPKGLYPLKRLIAMMTTELQARHPWMAGLPLVAAGYVSERYNSK